MLRFLQPCLLQLIRSGSRYECAAASDLTRFGFDEGSVDVSLVYRALREMESSGWIQSDWEDDGQGRSRRIQEIAEAGAQLLEVMMEDLERVQGEIDGILLGYRNEMPGGS